MTSFYRALKENPYACCAAFVIVLYFVRLTADTICGLYGIVWSDEGVYLLSAKNQVLFGQAHFFLRDLWKPELLSPLLHYFALLTITADEPLLWVRAGIALHIVAGIALISWLCARYHHNTKAGIACFFWVAINPLLFFYSHIGLSEGLQFFIMVLVLASLYALYHAKSFVPALLWSALTGALSAVFVFAKISAFPAGIALGIGFLATLLLNPPLSRKWLHVVAALAAFLAVTAVYFGIIVGDEFFFWWRANIVMEVASRAPQDIPALIVNFFNTNQDAAFYLCFMPVYAFYLLALLFAADRKRGFLFVLWIITVTAMLLESLLAGEVRRNFFSLSLLSVLFGFCALDFFTQGVRRNWKLSALTLVSAAIILLHAGGLAVVLARNIYYENYKLTIFCLLFLLLLALAYQTAEPWFKGSKQRVLICLIALTSLMPMMFQAFLTPRTNDEIAADIEARVPPDATIVGELAPWFTQRVKRRIIFTNCDMPDFAFLAANDIRIVEPYADFFIGDPSTEHCMPEGYTGDSLITTYSIFSPMNQRKLWEFNHRISYLGLIMLYEK